MANTLTVMDPDESAKETATDTRSKLQEWADRHFPEGAGLSVHPLSDVRTKELRAEGSAWFAEASGVPLDIPKSQFGGLLRALVRATRFMGDQYSKEAQPREMSYALEGMVKEFHKQFYQQGMQWNTQAEYLALISAQSPNRTGSLHDDLFRQEVGSILGMHHALGERDENEAWHAWAGITDACAEKFKPILPWIAGKAGDWAGTLTEAMFLRRVGGFNHVGVQLHYIDHDGPWVAGFLTLEDACRLRFRRVRLGAYLTEQGFTSEDVRRRVETAKQVVAGGVTFKALPNDTDWEDTYTHGPSSCMSDSADEYECWDGLHPVAAYSSSMHGSGDNGLVLLMSCDESGDITGRGILNVNKGTIVRWYGDPIAQRILLRNGVNVADRGSLEGSWLALLQRGAKFIHPYVDGDLGYGWVNTDNNRVYIVDDNGFICIQETTGSSYLESTHWCIDVQAERPEDECVYQPKSGNYISDDCDSWRCPVIDEYARPEDRSYMDIHGVSVEVSDLVRYNANMWLTREGYSDSYTIDDPDQRRRFFNEYDIEEPEDEDEEAA